jgi:hypothetical protein
MKSTIEGMRENESNRNQTSTCPLCLRLVIVGNPGVRRWPECPGVYGHTKCVNRVYAEGKAAPRTGWPADPLRSEKAKKNESLKQ